MICLSVKGRTSLPIDRESTDRPRSPSASEQPAWCARRPSSTAATMVGVCRVRCRPDPHAESSDMHPFWSRPYGRKRSSDRGEALSVAGLPRTRAGSWSEQGGAMPRHPSDGYCRTSRRRCGPRCQHGGKYRLEVAGRAGNDLQHLRCGRLLLQRFGELLACAAARPRTAAHSRSQSPPDRRNVATSSISRSVKGSTLLRASPMAPIGSPWRISGTPIIERAPPILASPFFS